MRECNAIILAGGFGSRLKSITGDNIPKPMARINGMPVIEHQVLQCKNYGFSKILILLHHLPQIIIDYLGDGSKYGVQIEYVIEAEPRGTAGAVLDALDFLAETFLVIYGDTFFDVNLQKFFASKLLNLSR
jgi:NDP-sugar pyrophosphorylase family protein